MRQRVMLVADQTTEYEQVALELLRSMQVGGGPVGAGGFARPTPNIVDTVHFVQSETDPGGGH